jgi:hypothetical protein
MLTKIIICAALVFFTLFVNVALSEMGYPPELNQVSAPYPGATIVQTTNASGSVMVTMESNDNLDSIFEFYKNELPANGWTTTAETQSQGHSGLMGEKGSNNAIVNIGTGQSGKSIIMLMLAPKK